VPASKSRSNITIKSRIIEKLSKEFSEYLKSDGVRLPKEATKVSSCAPSANTESDDEWGSDEDDVEQDEISFPEMTQSIETAIHELGGSVIPKLNWSSPKDATWINGGTLKCQYPGDVYLLLKSSDFVMHDLLTIGKNQENNVSDCHLVLRKWCNLHASMEFRCFVYNTNLVAICQRNHTQHYKHVVRDRMLFRSQIMDFFDDYITENFRLENYIFDVYIDKQERVWLIDFNVWGRQTDGLLFEWDELDQLAGLPIVESGVSPPEMLGDLDNAHPVIRVVETENAIRHDPLASYRAPTDAVDLATVGGAEFEEFMKLCENPKF